jgi:hypothetical protein
MNQALWNLAQQVNTDSPEGMYYNHSTQVTTVLYFVFHILHAHKIKFVSVVWCGRITWDFVYTYQTDPSMMG